MSPKVLILIYSLLIIGGSVMGGWLPTMFQLTHRGMQMMMSLVGGLMLGVGLLHLLPHGIAESGSVDLTIAWVLAGLLVMFFLIRMFDFHQHNVVNSETRGHSGHGHAESHPAHGLSWLGVALGLSLHTFIDGVALGAAVMSDYHHNHELILCGFAIFLAIVLHKPLDALSITTLMSAGGWSPRSRLLVNLGFAIMCPLGAAMVILGAEQFDQQQHVAIGCALGFSAGVFLCISLSDLLPELQFHKHDRITLSVLLLLGVGIAYLIGLFEPDHLHGNGHQIPHGDHHHSQSLNSQSPVEIRSS